MLVNMVNNTTEQYYSLPESWCQLTSQCVSGWVKLNPFNCVKSVVRYVGKVDLKFYRFSTWFTTVSRQCRYSAGRRRASTSIKFSRGLTCLHAHLYVKCRQVNNCMYTSNFGPSHHQSGLPKPKCDRLKWCKAGFWSAWPVAHCLKDTQALLCMGHIDRGQLSSSLCHGPSQNCMSMIIMYVNSLQRGPLTNHLLKRNLEH